jgi:integrase/recombinase XerD
LEYWRLDEADDLPVPRHGKELVRGRPDQRQNPVHACREAAQRAGIAKHVAPHTLRHCFATHLLEARADLRTIQVLLGHAKVEHTIVYLHLSQKHLTAVANPLETITVSSPENSKRSRKLQRR